MLNRVITRAEVKAAVGPVSESRVTECLALIDDIMIMTRGRNIFQYVDHCLIPAAQQSFEEGDDMCVILEELGYSIGCVLSHGYTLADLMTA